MSFSKQRQLLPSIADKEIRFQQNRLNRVSNLEGRLRKHHALNKAHKTVVKELYSGKEKLTGKQQLNELPAIVVAPSPLAGDNNNHGDSDDDGDYSAGEDETNFLKYTGRRCGSATNLPSLTAENNFSGPNVLDTPPTTRRCSSAQERRPSVALCETNFIYDTWESQFKSSDDMNLSLCNFLKKPEQNGRRSSGDNRANKCASPLDLLTRSTEALDALKGNLEPGDRRPSSGSRRSSLYQLNKSETDIWRHCQRVQRRRSVSLNDVSVDQLKKCRYLRIPERYSEAYNNGTV